MTGEPRKLRILIADDEPSSLLILEAILTRDGSYEIYKATDGNKAIAVAELAKPDIIVCDYMMPGKNGFEVCRHIKANPALSRTIFIVLSGDLASSTKIEGFEAGVDDFIEKPIVPTLYYRKLKSLSRIKSLQDRLEHENEELSAARAQLEKNFNEMVTVLLRVVELIVPGVGDRSRAAKAAARFITEKYEIPDEKKRQIVIAATLHEVGKVGLPIRIARAQYKTLSAEDKEVYRQFPSITSKIIASITGLEEIAAQVDHMLENYDGSGKPSGLMRDEIGLGSKILRAIIFQEEYYAVGVKTSEIIREITAAVNKVLDPRVASELIAFLIEGDKEFSKDKQKISLEQLEADMVVAEDVYASSGVKLLPQGTRLQERTIELVLDRSKKDPILGGIYIYKRVST